MTYNNDINKPISNWFMKFDYICWRDGSNNLISNNQINVYATLIGSFLGFGEITGAFLFNYLSDIIGRRILMIYGGILWMIIDFIIIFNNNLYAMYVLIFLNGFFSFSNHIVAYNYAGEVTNNKYKLWVYTLVQVGDGMVWSILCLY